MCARISAPRGSVGPGRNDLELLLLGDTRRSEISLRCVCANSYNRKIRNKQIIQL